MDSNEAAPGEVSQQIQPTPDKTTEPTDNNNNNNTDPKTTLTSNHEEGDQPQTSENQDNSHSQNQDSQERESEYGMDTDQENNILNDTLEAIPAIPDTEEYSQSDFTQTHENTMINMAIEAEENTAEGDASAAHSTGETSKITPRDTLETMMSQDLFDDEVNYDDISQEDTPEETSQGSSDPTKNTYTRKKRSCVKERNYKELDTGVPQKKTPKTTAPKTTSQKTSKPPQEPAEPQQKPAELPPEKLKTPTQCNECEKKERIIASLHQAANRKCDNCEKKQEDYKNLVDICREKNQEIRHLKECVERQAFTITRKNDEKQGLTKRLAEKDIQIAKTEQSLKEATNNHATEKKETEEAYRKIVNRRDDEIRDIRKELDEQNAKNKAEEKHKLEAQDAKEKAERENAELKQINQQLQTHQQNTEITMQSLLDTIQKLQKDQGDKNITQKKITTLLCDSNGLIASESIQKKLGYEVKTVPTFTTEELIQQAEQQPEENVKDQEITILVGTNNLKKGQKAIEVIKDLQKATQTLEEKGAKVMVTQVPPCKIPGVNYEVKKLNGMIETNFGNKVITTASLFSTDNKKSILADDKIHLNKKGIRILTEAICSKLITITVPAAGQDDQAETTAEMVVDNVIAGHIIGKDGKAIQEIKKKYKVEINTRHRTDTTAFEITGKTDEVMKAREDMEETEKSAQQKEKQRNEEKSRRAMVECRFYRMGNCERGNACHFRHSKEHPLELSLKASEEHRYAKKPDWPPLYHSQPQRRAQENMEDNQWHQHMSRTQQKSKKRPTDYWDQSSSRSSSRERWSSTPRQRDHRRGKGERDPKRRTSDWN